MSKPMPAPDALRRLYGPLPSVVTPDMRRIVTSGAIAAYLFTQYVLMAFLPEKWFGDSSRLLAIANNVAEGSGSYAATAALYSFFPEWALGVAVSIVGCIFLFAAYRSVQTWSSLIMLSVVLVFAVPQLLLVPNKETIVIGMSLFIFYLGRISNIMFLSAGIFGIYIVYGFFIRHYYMLILILWVFLIVFGRSNIIVKSAIVYLIIVIVFCAPLDLLELMQGQRDLANRWAIYIVHADNRTAFFNPLEIDGPVSFLVNYFYAGFVLTFPLLVFQSAKEIVFSILLLFVFYAALRGLRSCDRCIRHLSFLFTAHLLVLWIFEPDLGSYFRHFTSALAYLFPAFGLIGGATLGKVPVKRLAPAFVRQRS